MGKGRRKGSSEVEFLRGQVRQLQAQLKYFKKREHLIHTAPIEEIANEFDLEDVAVNLCPQCQKGALIEYDFNFIVLRKCDCGYQERQKKKGQL